MKFNTTEMCQNEIIKGTKLITCAAELGMDMSGYGMIGVNPNSGNIYLWLENYQFTLYIGPCDESIMVAWTDPEDDEKFIEELSTFDCTNPLFYIQKWCCDLEKKSELKREED